MLQDQHPKWSLLAGRGLVSVGTWLQSILVRTVKNYFSRYIENTNFQFKECDHSQRAPVWCVQSWPPKLWSPLWLHPLLPSPSSGAMLHWSPSPTAARSERDIRLMARKKSSLMHVTVTNVTKRSSFYFHSMTSEKCIENSVSTVQQMT